MPLGPVALAMALTLSPPAAGRFALLAIGVEPTIQDGRRDLGAQLERIAHRESVGAQGTETDVDAWARSARVGIHIGDAYLSDKAYRNAVKYGRVDRACQTNEIWEAGYWASRGPWGFMAGLYIDRLPACAQPHWFDVPLVSALVAARKYMSQCEPAGRPRSGWCKRT